MPEKGNPMPNNITLRQAENADVSAIAALLKPYADEGVVLPRDEENIRFYLQNFRVAVAGNAIVGCVAVRDFGNRLFEVRSLVVARDLHGTGIGRMLVENEIGRLRSRFDEWKLFTLTRTPEFFIRLGFQTVDRTLFPEKIWSDCASCSKNRCCDETALLISHRK